MMVRSPRRPAGSRPPINPNTSDLACSQVSRATMARRVILQSPLLHPLHGVRHGFATRLGGVSRGRVATFNFGHRYDTADARAENRRRFALRLGIAGVHRLCEVNQVHGTEVATAPLDSEVEADALVCDVSGWAIGVRTADCAPILVACCDDRGRATAVAAIHAGWRGATAGIVSTVLERLVARGAQTEFMRAAIGPTIGIDRFEVGEEVVAAARVSLNGEAPKTRPGPAGRPLLDLRHLVTQHLLAAGLPRHHIDHVGCCTYDAPALFFSYRRDQGLNGTHLSAISFGV